MENQHDRGRRDGDFVLSSPTEVENELPYQLTGVGCDFYQYPVDRPFGFALYQWIQTITGSGVLRTGSEEIPVGEGQGMLLYPDETHAYHSVDEPWYVHWITFSGHHVENMLHYLGMPQTGVYTVSDTPIIESVIRKGLAILKSDYPLRGLDGSALVYELLLTLLKYHHGDGVDSRSGTMMKLKPAFDYIERELHTPLALDDLAATAGVTPQYFCDIFKDATGHRPTEYINQRRVDRAKQFLLLEPRTKVREIARRVGFESDSYFAAVFRKFEGITPNEFRKTNANRAG